MVFKLKDEIVWKYTKNLKGSKGKILKVPQTKKGIFLAYINVKKDLYSSDTLFSEDETEMALVYLIGNATLSKVKCSDLSLQ